jgi:hypothetical protein
MPCRLAFVLANMRLRPAAVLRISDSNISSFRGISYYSRAVVAQNTQYDQHPTLLARGGPIDFFKRRNSKRCFSTVTPGTTTDHLLLANNRSTTTATTTTPPPPLAKQPPQQQTNEEVGNMQQQQSLSTGGSSTSACGLTRELQQEHQYTMPSSSLAAPSPSHDYVELMANAAEQAEQILADLRAARQVPCRRPATTSTQNQHQSSGRRANTDEDVSDVTNNIQQAIDAAQALLVAVSKLPNSNAENSSFYSGSGGSSSSSSASTISSIKDTHWYSLHRAMVCIASKCLDLIEVAQQQQQLTQPLLVPSSSTTTTTTSPTKLLLDCTLAIVRRARHLNLPLHLPLYQRLANALALQHAVSRNTDSRFHDTSAMHDMDHNNNITDVLLEVASHSNVWELSASALQQSSSSSSSSSSQSSSHYYGCGSFFNTPLVILVEHCKWKEANELLMAVARRMRRQHTSSSSDVSPTLILDEQVAMQLILLLRQVFREHRPASASVSAAAPPNNTSRVGPVRSLTRQRRPSGRHAMSLVALLEPTLLRMIHQHELEEQELEDEEDEELLSLPQLLYQQDYFYSYPKPMRQFLQNRWFQSLHREQAAAILSRMMLEQQQRQQAATNHDHDEEYSSNGYYEEADDIFNSDNNGDDKELNDDDPEELADALFFLLGQDGTDDDIFDKHMDLLDLQIEKILTKRVKDDQVKCLVSDLLRHAELPSAHVNSNSFGSLHFSSDDDNEEDEDDHHNTRSSRNDDNSLLPTCKSYKGSANRRRNNRTTTPQQQQGVDVDIDEADSSDSDYDEDSSDSDSDSDENDEDDLFRQRRSSGYDLPDINGQVKSWNGGHGVVLTEKCKDTLYRKSRASFDSDIDSDDDDDDLFQQRHCHLPDIIAQVKSWNGGHGVVLTEEYKDTLYSNMLRDVQREMNTKFSSPSSSRTSPKSRK